jgi:REP element-mobilizing transposase RayT
LLIYTSQNCPAAYQLNWSLSIFWHDPVVSPDSWLEPFKDVVENDGVRILEHHLSATNVSQFLLSTKPQVSPSSAIRSVKGRLQYLVRQERPKAFRRNYWIQSVGSADLDTIENYVASQIEHHSIADLRIRERLQRYQINDPRVDLSSVQRSSHGEFTYNLHLVLLNSERDIDVSEESLQITHDGILRISCKKGHRLSRAGITGDHLHITLGADVGESPTDVALAYLNNLAFLHKKPVFQSGYFVGTFGQYDLGAIWNSIAAQATK